MEGSWTTCHCPSEFFVQYRGANHWDTFHAYDCSHRRSQGCSVPPRQNPGYAYDCAGRLITSSTAKQQAIDITSEGLYKSTHHHHHHHYDDEDDEALFSINKISGLQQFARDEPSGVTRGGGGRCKCREHEEIAAVRTVKNDVCVLILSVGQLDVKWRRYAAVWSRSTTLNAVTFTPPYRKLNSSRSSISCNVHSRY